MLIHNGNSGWVCWFECRGLFATPVRMVSSWGNANNYSRYSGNAAVIVTEVGRLWWQLVWLVVVIVVIARKIAEWQAGVRHAMNTIKIPDKRIGITRSVATSCKSMKCFDGLQMNQKPKSLYKLSLYNSTRYKHFRRTYYSLYVLYGL